MITDNDGLILCNPYKGFSCKLEYKHIEALCKYTII